MEPKKTYSEQLKDPRWQKKRLEIMSRDGFTCKLCGDKETTLNIHHKQYDYNCKPWEYSDDKLITICEHCHKEVEDNKVFINIGGFSGIKVHKSTGWTSGTRIMFLSVPGTCSVNVYDKNNKRVIGFDFEEEIESVINVFKNGL